MQCLAEVLKMLHANTKHGLWNIFIILCLEKFSDLNVVFNP